MDPLSFSKAINTLRVAVVRVGTGASVPKWYDLVEHPIEMAIVKVFYSMVKVGATKAGKTTPLEMTDDIQTFELAVLAAYFEHCVG